MAWKQLLVSITRSVDQALQWYNAYLATENHILRSQIQGRVQLSNGDHRPFAEHGQTLGQQALEKSQ